MRYEKLDNLIVRACRSADFIRIQSVLNNTYFCDGFISVTETENEKYICFKQVYDVKHSTLHKNKAFPVSLIDDIEFSFKS